MAFSDGFVEPAAILDPGFGDTSDGGPASSGGYEPNDSPPADYGFATYSPYMQSAGMGGNLAGPMPIQQQDTPPSSAQLGVTSQEAGDYIDQGQASKMWGNIPLLSGAFQTGQAIASPWVQNAQDIVGDLTGATDGRSAQDRLNTGGDLLMQTAGAPEISLATQFIPDALRVARAGLGNTARSIEVATRPNIVAHALGPQDDRIPGALSAEERAKLTVMRDRLGAIGPQDKGGLIDQPDFLQDRAKALENVPGEFQTGPNTYGHGDTTVPDDIRSTTVDARNLQQVKDSLDATHGEGTAQRLQDWLDSRDSKNVIRDGQGDILDVRNRPVESADKALGLNKGDTARYLDAKERARQEQNAAGATDSPIYKFVKDEMDKGTGYTEALDKAGEQFGHDTVIKWDRAMSDNSIINGRPQMDAGSPPDTTIHLTQADRDNMAAASDTGKEAALRGHLYDSHEFPTDSIFDTQKYDTKSVEEFHDIAHEQQRFGEEGPHTHEPPSISGGAGNDVPGAQRFTVEQGPDGKYWVMDQMAPGGPKPFLSNGDAKKAQEIADRLSANHAKDANVGPEKTADQTKAALTNDELAAKQAEAAKTNPEGAAAFGLPRDFAPGNEELRQRIEALRAKSGKAADEAEAGLAQVQKAAAGPTFDQTALPFESTFEGKTSPFDNVPEPLKPGETPPVGSQAAVDAFHNSPAGFQNIQPTLGPGGGDVGSMPPPLQTLRDEAPFGGGDVGPANHPALESTATPGQVQPGIPQGAADMRGASRIEPGEGVPPYEAGNESRMPWEQPQGSGGADSGAPPIHATQPELFSPENPGGIGGLGQTIKNTAGKVGDIATEGIRTLRAAMASSDISATFNQGLIGFVTHNPEWREGMMKQIESLKSEEGFTAATKEIQAMDSHALAMNLKRPLALDMSPAAASTDESLLNGGKGLGEKNEYFTSKIAEELPGIGPIIRASDRAFTGFQNSLRASIFDTYAKSWGLLDTEGKSFAELEKIQRDAQDLADFVNSITGRGNLGNLEKASGALNTLMFAPRFFASRIGNMMYPLTSTMNALAPAGFKAGGELPGALVGGVSGASLDENNRLEGFARGAVQGAVAGRLLGGKDVIQGGGSWRMAELATRDMSLYTGAVVGTLAAAKAAGADVNVDPSSTGFGKIHIGDSFIDVTGGMANLIRTAYRLQSGNYTSGKGNTFDLYNGKNPNAPTAWDVMVDYLRGSASPGAEIVPSALHGNKDLAGNDLGIGGHIPVPLGFRDLYDAWQTDMQNNNDPEHPNPELNIGPIDVGTLPTKENPGLTGAAIGASSLAGVRVNTYNPQAKPVQQSMNPIDQGIRYLTGSDGPPRIPEQY